MCGSPWCRSVCRNHTLVQMHSSGCGCTPDVSLHSCSWAEKNAMKMIQHEGVGSILHWLVLLRAVQKLEIEFCLQSMSASLACSAVRHREDIAHMLASQLLCGSTVASFLPTFNMSELNLTIIGCLSIRKDSSEELMLNPSTATYHKGFSFRPVQSGDLECAITTSPWLGFLHMHLGLRFGVHLVRMWRRASAVVSSKGNLFCLHQHCTADQTSAQEVRTIWGFSSKPLCCFETTTALMQTQSV